MNEIWSISTWWHSGHLWGKSFGSMHLNLIKNSSRKWPKTWLFMLSCFLHPSSHCGQNTSVLFSCAVSFSDCSGSASILVFFVNFLAALRLFSSSRRSLCWLHLAQVHLQKLQYRVWLDCTTLCTPWWLHGTQKWVLVSISCFCSSGAQCFQNQDFQNIDVFRF